VLAEVGLHGSDTDGSHALDLAVLAEEPKSQVDIVDRAVHKYSTGELGVRNEEATWIELVASLGAEDRWCTDITVGCALVSIAVGGVEATREAANDFLVGEFLDGGVIGVDDRLGLLRERDVNLACLGVKKSSRRRNWLGKRTHNLRAGTDRLLAKNVETTLNGLDGLLRVDGGSASNDNGLESLLLLQHLSIVLVDANISKFRLRGIQLSLHRRADSDQLGARGEIGEVASMAHSWGVVISKTREGCQKFQVAR
jgi:hypothetical protein